MSLESTVFQWSHSVQGSFSVKTLSTPSALYSGLEDLHRINLPLISDISCASQHDTT